MMTEEEATDMLTACRGLLARIEASGRGIYYRPTAEDQPIIEGIMRVCVDYASPEKELTLKLLRHRAGLSPSDWALVYAMAQHYTLSLPGVAKRRMEELRRHFRLERGRHDDDG